MNFMVAALTGGSRIFQLSARRQPGDDFGASRHDNGAASDELLTVVRNAFNDENVRPVADRVTVQSAQIT